MFPNFLNLISRRMQPGYDREFVKRVEVKEKAPRNRRLERLIWICWGLIAVKCVVVVWAVRHYAIPFSPLWVIAPTVAFAALCTAVYYWRN
jgi:hypothetical protein